MNAKVIAKQTRLKFSLEWEEHACLVIFNTDLSSFQTPALTVTRRQLNQEVSMFLTRLSRCHELKIIHLVLFRQPVISLKLLSKFA